MCINQHKRIVKDSVLIVIYFLDFYSPTGRIISSFFSDVYCDEINFVIQSKTTLLGPVSEFQQHISLDFPITILCLRSNVFTFLFLLSGFLPSMSFFRDQPDQLLFFYVCLVISKNS